MLKITKYPVSVQLNDSDCKPVEKDKDPELLSDQAFAYVIDKDKKMTFTANQSPKDKCFRLVHDGKSALHLLDSDGITVTALELFCGTEKECLDEIKKLNLIDQALERDTQNEPILKGY